jgi:RNA polymerase primary sigma factor
LDLSKYYALICKTPLLSREEELALFTKHRDKATPQKEKDKIREKIINANLRFPFKQAKNFSRNDPTMFPDLISAGNEGLLVGFEKYNLSNEVRFLSYAGWWVNQRILKEMSRMRIVSLPIWKQQLASRIAKEMEANEKITLEELQAKFVAPNVSKKDVAELFQTRYLTYYIDDMQEEEFEIDPIGEEVQKRIDDNRMWKMVADLPSPHREVIARCFGLEDGVESSPAKMSKALKVPKDDIQRIKAEALEMLKSAMELKKD